LVARPFMEDGIRILFSHHKKKRVPVERVLL